MVMQPYALTRDYWNEVVSRIRKVLVDLHARAQPSSEGRVIPEDSLQIGTGKRLQLAVLFLDISRFSALPCDNHLEQDLVLNVLNLFMSEAVRAAEDYGATVEKNTGDGLLAYFSAEELGSDEKACAAAVAFSLTLLYVTRHLINPILLNSGLRPIAFRTAIDFGMVTVANVGAPRRFKSIVAIGTAANIASKMLSHAGPDQVLIGDSVRKRLPQTWTQFCRLYRYWTEFVYTETGLPYPYYEYTGRWRMPS